MNKHMKRGFFSHQLCCGRSLLNKHILYLTMDYRIDSLLPFQREVSLTTFCEGLLIVVSPMFDKLKDKFISSLLQDLQKDSTITIGEAVLHNSIYRKCCINDDEECRLYAITSIDWQTGRLRDNTNIELIEVMK